MNVRVWTSVEDDEYDDIPNVWGVDIWDQDLTVFDHDGNGEPTGRYEYQQGEWEKLEVVADA